MKSSYFSSIAAALFFVTSCFAPCASAQFVVSTPDEDALVAQRIIQGAAEIAKLAEIASTAKDTYGALGNGVTEFASLPFGPTGSVPGTTKDALNLTDSTGHASDLAKSIVQGASKLDDPSFTGVSPFVKGNLTASMNASASRLAANEDDFETAVQEKLTLDKIQLDIATSTTVKSSMDAAARAAAEVASILNREAMARALDSSNNAKQKADELSKAQELFQEASRKY